MIIFDDHLHLDPKGKGWQAISEFKRSGGTHALVVHKPYRYSTLSEEPEDYYQEMFRTTLDQASGAGGKTGVECYAAVGPYPVEMVRYFEESGDIEASVDRFTTGIDLAEDLISAGEAVCFGEVGRPHFPAPEEVAEACDQCLVDVMERARGLGCAVIIHSEGQNDNPGVWRELAALVDKAGIEPGRVVKHFSPPVVDIEKNCGLFPSVLSKRDFIEGALGQGTRFMMETDYIDDPRRPGAVLGPRTVPRVTKALMDKGVMTKEMARAIHVDNPKTVYGLELK